MQANWGTPFSARLLEECESFVIWTPTCEHFRQACQVLSECGLGLISGRELFPFGKAREELFQQYKEETCLCVEPVRGRDPHDRVSYSNRSFFDEHYPELFRCVFRLFGEDEDLEDMGADGLSSILNASGGMSS